MEPSTRAAFASAPHRTFLGLAFPVLVSLIAEPLTGLVDTAFIARLGSVPLTALGVGTIVLSGSFWVFNFLGMGTQTEVAQAAGAGQLDRAGGLASLAAALAVLIGAGVMIAGWFAAGTVATWMEATGAVYDPTVSYIRMRLLGGPAVLVTMAAFGALRGLSDMQTPLKIAVGVNLLNIALDGPLVFGWGPIPRLEVAGAGLASSAAQWIGAIWALWAVHRRLGLSSDLPFSDTPRLLAIGRDLFLRTGALTLFLVLATRAATRIGPDAGAAHQAIRQVWAFSAFVLDAFAVAGQTLIGQFLGAGDRPLAKRVATVVVQWSLGTGAALTAAMLLGTPLAVALLVPSDARAVFYAPWVVAAVSQPVSALSFGTDGIHWGTGDFAFLRNVVVLATTLGAVGLFFLDERGPWALLWIWVFTAGWVGVRAAFGVLRIWPGLGDSPLGRPS